MELEMLILNDRQKELIKYIQSLDKGKRHAVTIVCRGTEPWEIKEHITETKIPLIPK